MSSGRLKITVAGRTVSFMSTLTHKERFRAAVQRLTPLTPALTANEYVPRQTTPTELSVAFELDPNRLVSLEGPIGCGKTTELNRARIALSEGTERTRAAFVVQVDVGEEIRLADVSSWSVAGLLLQTTVSELRKVCQENPAKLQRLGSLTEDVGSLTAGGWDFAERNDHVQLHDYKYVQGIQAPAKSTINDSMNDSRLSALLGRLAHAVTGAGYANLVFFVDGLDRLPSDFGFQALLVPLLVKLRNAKIGAAVVLPPGAHRPSNLELNALLETTVHVRPFPASERPAFATRLLQSRGVTDMFEPEAVPALGEFGAGIPRDTIQVAREALQLAYRAQRLAATKEDVVAAADNLGRGMLLRLTLEQARVVQKVGRTGRFDAIGDDELKLVSTKCVVQEETSPARIISSVHPALSLRLYSASEMLRDGFVSYGLDCLEHIDEADLASELDTSTSEWWVLQCDYPATDADTIQDVCTWLGKTTVQVDAFSLLADESESGVSLSLVVLPDPLPTRLVYDWNFARVELQTRWPLLAFIGSEAAIETVRKAGHLCDLASTNIKEFSPQQTPQIDVAAELAALANQSGMTDQEFIDAVEARNGQPGPDTSFRLALLGRLDLMKRPV